MKLTSSGIQFVKDLLVRLPSERLTAETAQHAPWLRKGHELFISPSHPTALSQQQSGVAKLPRPAPIDCMVTNSTQDAAPFLLPKHPKTFATGGNSTARPSKDQKLDQLRVEPTNVSSESSDAWRRSPKSYHAMEENLIGKANEKERSEEGGEERDGDTVFEPSTHNTRDHESFSNTPLRRTFFPPISVSLQKAERTEATRLLRDAGFDFDAPNYSAKSAWFWAAKHGCKAVTLLLLEQGADIEVKDNDGRTALHHAASNGHEAVAHLFLEKGADIEVENKVGRTALHHAASNGHEAVARMFLEKGADILVKNNYGMTALHHAAWDGHEAVARLFLEKGADIEMKDDYRSTALHFAAFNGHEAVARLFLKEGADIEVKNKVGGTALHIAASNGHEAVGRLLLEEGADIEVKNKVGMTALHVAARYGHEAVICLLLDKGADIRARSSWGSTAAKLATKGGYENCAKLLKTPSSGRWGIFRR
ncbi:MAG: ankyrin repeat-containing protein [Lasallia pustulata]|uniref:Ankyrin repeat-containing protein n=1 Tax=Lasallia pustulata TaxID=136370 RepID=A0A5M8PXR3_9LECA|nr:MAG: ankyrin repeat-containing protein [Lasallia pustulata]